MCITCRAAAALGVWAALHTAPGALAETPSPAYWAGPRLERPTVRTALAVAPQQISVPGSEAGVFVHQIDPRAAGTRQPLRSRFASWYLRRHCRNGGEFSEYCKRMQSPYETAGTGDAPRPAPAGLADLTLDAGVALIPAASPAPYIPRRHDWLHPELEPSPAAILPELRPCNGVCQQFAGIVQSASGGGIDNAATYQWGPNVALTMQQASGTGINSSLTSQWGACNHALVAQAVSSASNTSAVSQAGYNNTSVVYQH